MKTGILTQLLSSDEPAIRYKVRVQVLGEDPDQPDLRTLRQSIATSPRVQTLFSERGSDGHIPHHPYQKWTGAHWVLANLADLGYPPGDQSLAPLLDDCLSWLLGPGHRKSIRQIDSRVRRCASQEGNAVFYALRLGLPDPRVDELAERLLVWQWPDGGWNCDKRQEAIHSSFMETLIPLRALALYAKTTGGLGAAGAAARAAEIFLKRHLFRRQHDGAIMDPHFVRLHYPVYWHYDILAGLKVMAEAGFLDDPRCQDALDLLASKQLPGGGFPAEGKYYRRTDQLVSGRSLVDWGGTGAKQPNQFVTAEALAVLAASGRFTPADHSVPIQVAA
jgi:hypothetical protein